MSAFRFSTQPGDILQEMATKVRQLRKQSGYSQEELARRSGVSFGSIKRFESSGTIFRQVWPVRGNPWKRTKATPLPILL